MLRKVEKIATHVGYGKELRDVPYTTVEGETLTDFVEAFPESLLVKWLNQKINFEMNYQTRVRESSQDPIDLFGKRTGER